MELWSTLLNHHLHRGHESAFADPAGCSSYGALHGSLPPFRPTLSTNVEYTRKLVQDLRKAGQKLAPDDPTALALDATTRKEREDKKVLGPEFDLDELWQRRERLKF
jgi:hypothetical protein